METFNYPWIKEYCLAKPGATKDYKEDWQMHRFQVGGKTFASIHGNKEGEPILTVRLEPANGDFFRDEYADVVPGYYHNKMHYNSISLKGKVPDAVLKDLIDESYGIFFRSLTKKAQNEIRIEK